MVENIICQDQSSTAFHGTRRAAVSHSMYVIKIVLLPTTATTSRLYDSLLHCASQKYKSKTPFMGIDQTELNTLNIV